MDPVDGYIIPIRYNKVLEYLRKDGGFGYLEFDGSRFKVPVEKVKTFYLDLKELLPKGALMKTALSKMSVVFDKWKSLLYKDEIDGISKEMKDDLDFDIVEDYLELETPRELEPPPDVSVSDEHGGGVDGKEKEIDWEKIGKIFLIILFILFIIAIVVGIVVLVAGAGGDIDLPNFDGKLLDAFSGINFSGGGGSEDEARRQTKNFWNR